MSDFDEVRRMYRVFGLHRGEGNAPHGVADSVMAFRVAAMREEVAELADAHEGGDLAGVADALVDLVVFALGTAVLCDLPWDNLFLEVMRANLRKVTGPGVRERGLGEVDLLKPPSWAPPNIRAVLETAGWWPPED